MRRLFTALCVLAWAQVASAAWINLSAAAANYPTAGGAATAVNISPANDETWRGVQFSGSAQNEVYWNIANLPQDFDLASGTLTCTLKLINGTASGASDLSFKITACAFPVTATGYDANGCTDSATSSTTSATAVTTNRFDATLSANGIYNVADAANCTTGQTHSCVGQPFRIELWRRGNIDSNTATIEMLGMACEY